MGIFVAIAFFDMGYLIPHPMRSEVVGAFDDLPLAALWPWIAGFAVLFGLAVTFFPRPRGRWGQTRESWFDTWRSWTD